MESPSILESVLDSNGHLMPNKSPENYQTNDTEMKDEELPDVPLPDYPSSKEETISNAQPQQKESRKRYRETRDSKPNRERNNGDNKRPKKRPRCDEKTALEMSIKASEVSIGKLETHIENNTCPKTLRYNVRAKIRPDPEFKTDISRIRKEAERKLLGALKTFHYRSVERNRAKQRELERKSRSSLKPSTSRNTDVNRDLVKSEQKNVTTSADSVTENVQMSARNIQAQIDSLKKMMKTLEKATKNKQSESYPCLLSECTDKIKRGENTEKRKIRNKKHNTRRNIARQKREIKTNESNKRHIKNLSTTELTTDQINLISKGLKFIPTPVTRENHIKHQLMQDFNQFARRMRLQYIYHGEDKTQHPFHVKSNWNPPVQPSVALESYLEEVKLQLAEMEITKPKNNLPYNERKAIKELKENSEINIKKADKGTTTVIMNKQDKITEGQIQLRVIDSYRTLETPMVKETSVRVKRLVTELYQRKHIDAMTKKWLSQTPNPPRIPEFYTLTKIHKANSVGRPIILGCEGPTERISSFVDSLLQPIAKQQTSYLKDTTDFINFLEKTKVEENTILVSMDVTSLYTNIPQEEGITTVCNAYENFH